MRNKTRITFAPVNNNKSFTATFEQVMEMNHSLIIHIKERLNTKYGNNKRENSISSPI
jgi:hypothetical protein